MRRKKWLRKRQERGLQKPVRARIMFTNAGGVSFGEKKTLKIVRKAMRVAEEYNVDFAGFCEVRDVNVLPELKQGWAGVQYGPVDSEQHGVSVVWKLKTTKVKKHVLRFGSHSTSEGSWKTGKGIGSRYFIQATTRFGEKKRKWTSKTKAGHAPPPRSPNARSEYNGEFTRGGGIMMSDWNLPARIILRLTGHKVCGDGVLFVAVPRKFKIKLIATPDVGSDHRAIIVEVY